MQVEKCPRLPCFTLLQTAVILHCAASIIWMNIIEHITKFWKARNIVIKASLTQASTVFMIRMN